jgi:hypothetical protein
MKTQSLLIVAAPLTLAIIELFHPHPHDLMALDVQTWLAVHYLQLPLFPLTAVALVLLLKQRTDIAAVICKIAMFVFAVSYTAFDTAAGIVTGILLKAAHASTTPDAWRLPIDTIWTHAIVGGSASGPPPLLAVLGSVALSIGTVSAAVSLKRSGSSWGPVLLLALSGFGIAVFKTHAWPGGPVTFGGMAIASTWLLLEGRHFPAEAGKLSVETET